MIGRTTSLWAPALLFLLWTTSIYGQNTPSPKTPTGFHYPINAEVPNDRNWSACGSAYYKDLRHIGSDLLQNEKLPVFAIADGTVIKKSGPAESSGWGVGNYALWIRHSARDGNFLALYGHIHTSLNEGDIVYAGKFIGTTEKILASVKKPNGETVLEPITATHLHFGIYPSSQLPTSPWGKWPDVGCTAPNSTNGFVAPITFIRTKIPAGGVVVSVSLRISQGNAIAPGSAFGMGQPMQGTFTIMNRGGAPVFMKELLIAGRLGTDTCPNGTCPDFLPKLRDITLAPGGIHSFTGSLQPPRPGTYNFDVVYQKADGSWQWPVDSDNGSKNHLTIIVQPGPTLSSAAPPSLIASPNKQRVILYGTGLAKTIYCRMILPNGKTTNLYIPLRQVISGSPDRIELSTEFRTSGRYYIRAHTLMEHSNELVIEVR